MHDVWEQGRIAYADKAVNEARKQERIDLVISMFKDGDITVDVAAKRLGVTTDEVIQLTKHTGRT